ncbi:MAG: peptide-methionine (S)-S-oxide reductase MsrA [Phenylobacterium sp.]|uniref:peptide-methionine (S)-S-oxide reductase MsrA n=1 Tax=Phenylobacterium sp. TaxID=1871053 RepID=UPI001B64B953|nr:peptide-methionine (S)-S-oxide reductase MsrA [Phenylobacterium sp.]MBP7651506.1 peptide-methionine (S)-S-oxide reductase MsrA [Phenylobacterium sp.]MBP7816727.1 peptide-methionine (S)-S-oxide reductase MsrA [Phenylobacterium sp.]MBP9230925.1 peptide-methionine (S)-S-oxide reductase MsrA [Phenylobacterium sp.]MBP9753838.1 peptide-methionine (S)-S-oxide reductase MsrA [Phenylobacterium sp.]
MNKPLFAATAAVALLLANAAPAAGALKTAVFAGGCFWSAEHDIEHARGVKSVVVGYAGGASARPTYENHEGHLEAIQVTYDPAQTSYSLLVANFFHHIDPTDPNGQICDQGPSYRTAVFVDGAAERAAAEAVKAQVAKELGKPVATMILPAATFHMGEGYHQDYAKKNPMAYNAYRVGCGREAALKAVWKRG